MHNASELIRAIASLMWPLLIAVALFLLRHELVGLVRRVRELDIAGTHAKLDPDLTHLQESAEAVNESLPEPDDESVEPARREDEAAVERALEEAVSSPKASLLLLSARIERELREALALRGHLDEARGPLNRQIRLLEIAPDVAAAYDEFRQVRNRIVHGYDASEDDVLRAVDSGRLILGALAKVPREVNYVYALSVELYADPEGLQVREGVHGVVLENEGRDGVPERRVYPTTRTHFRKGEPVAWQWNMAATWPETWYRDPDSERIDYGWTQSAEFIGAHLADL